jgi:hypothetical protein
VRVRDRVREILREGDSERVSEREIVREREIEIVREC